MWQEADGVGNKRGRGPADLLGVKRSDAVWQSGSSGAAGQRRQASQTDQVVRCGHEIASEVDPLEPAVARLPKASDRFHPAEYFFNGLFTNDKFCWSRPAKLRLKWWHRAYRDR